MSDRLPNGYFAAGNQVGRTPKKSSARANLELIRKAVTEDEVRELWRQVFEQAMQGCDKSQKLALEYLCGKPTQAIEIDSANGLEVVFADAMRKAVENA